jgi:dihydroxyacetone kinase
MQRIINDPNQVVEEMLQGFVKSHPDHVTAVPYRRRIGTQARVCRVHWQKPLRRCRRRGDL